jgi:hypothetical protein
MMTSNVENEAKSRRNFWFAQSLSRINFIDNNSSTLIKQKIKISLKWFCLLYIPQYGDWYCVFRTVSNTEFNIMQQNLQGLCILLESEPNYLPMSLCLEPLFSTSIPPTETYRRR